MGLFKRSRHAEQDGQPKVPVTAVFTPSIPAKLGFVGRDQELSDLIGYGLNVPGTQIAIWGESGAGKSTLIYKALLETQRVAVRTACTPDFSYEDILASAFSGTGAFHVTQVTDREDEKNSMSGTFGSEMVGAKANLSNDLSAGTDTVTQPIAPPQLTLQRLCSELGARNLSWIIEDFHKVDESVRRRLAHGLKVFSDEGNRYPQTTAIVLGVSESVGELVAGPTNVGTRLVDIKVPPLSEDDLGKILSAGEEHLNVDFASVRDRLLHTAVGTASIAHALALACCTERKMVETSDDPIQFTPDDFDGAMRGYVRTRSSTIKGRFESALRVERKRRFDNPRLLLRAITNLPVEGGSVGEILELVRREQPDYPSGNASSYLQSLQTEERGGVIRKTATGAFRFDEPLLHAYAKSYFSQPVDSEAANQTVQTEQLEEWDSALRG